MRPRARASPLALPRPAPLALALALALLLPGCSLIQEPEERQLEGATDGHQPTASFLKVFVRKDDGSLALMNFDRRDWYVAEIARKLDHREVPYLGATVMPRNTLNEYLVQHVTTPSDLDTLRYDAMGATPEARTSMDNEYEALLKRLAEEAGEILPPPATPTLPVDALP